jgi:hypothetical protein
LDFRSELTQLIIWETFITLLQWKLHGLEWEKCVLKLCTSQTFQRKQ